jgi:hypothetical protein
MPDISRLVIEIDSKGVLTANGDLEVFAKMGQKAGQTADDMAKKFGAFQLIVNKLPGPLRSLASGLMGMVSPAHTAISAFLELGEAVVNFAKESVQAFGDYELIKTNLELVMGSAKAANATFKELRDLAAKTPFSLPGVAQAASMLRQAGVAAGDLVSTIEMLGNVSGGSMERFNRIAYNYTQVLQKGIMDTRDTREFAGNLVPINKALQELGVTGKATDDDMVAAFRHMTKEGGMFFDAINRQGETLIGKTEQLKEAWIEFKATFAETTGLGQFWKDMTDSQTESIQNQTRALIANKEAREARSAIKSGEDTTSNRYKQYSNELILLDNEIHDLENKLGGRRDSEGIQLDILYEKRKKILDLLKPYENSVKALEESEKSRADILQKQKDLIESQAKKYDEFLSVTHERYASTQEGRLDALRKELEKYQTEYKVLLSQGRAEEQKNLQEFGPGNRYEVPIKLVYRPATDTERREYETAIRAVQKDIQEILEKSNPLKDWQIELGKIFNFNPTIETSGLSTIINYINDLAETRNKLFASYGDKTIADLLGISEMDQAEAELAELQTSLRKMLEFKGSESWTIDDESVKKLVDEITQKQADVNDRQYKEYIEDLDKELNLMYLSTREREKQKLLEDHFRIVEYLIIS